MTEWFDLGGNLHLHDALDAQELVKRTAQVQGLRDLASQTGAREDAPAPVIAAAIDFVLEGLYAQKKISRSDDGQYQGAEPPRRPARPAPEPVPDREMPAGGGKKKYYN